MRRKSVHTKDKNADSNESVSVPAMLIGILAAMVTFVLFIIMFHRIF